MIEKYSFALIAVDVAGKSEFLRRGSAVKTDPGNVPVVLKMYLGIDNGIKRKAGCNSEPGQTSQAR